MRKHPLIKLIIDIYNTKVKFGDALVNLLLWAFICYKLGAQ